MKRYISIALTALWITGCVEIPCDFVADGLCVVTGEHDVSPFLLSKTIEIVEQQTNEAFSDVTLDFATKAEHYDLRLTIIELQDERGVYFDDDTIEVAPSDADTASEACRDFYYVIGHELLHFVAHRHLGVSTKRNQQHDVPILFRADNYWTTVDCRVMIEVAKVCQAYYAD